MCLTRADRVAPERSGFGLKVFDGYNYRYGELRTPLQYTLCPLGEWMKAEGGIIAHGRPGYLAGFHIFTFNQLTDSVAWQKERQAAVDAAATPAAS